MQVQGIRNIFGEKFGALTYSRILNGNVRYIERDVQEPENAQFMEAFEKRDISTLIRLYKSERVTSKLKIVFFLKIVEAHYPDLSDWTVIKEIYPFACASVSFPLSYVWHLIVGVAVEDGCLDLVHPLLQEKGLDINYLHPERKETILHVVTNDYATHPRNVMLAALLLLNGANVHIKNAQRESPLDLALKHKYYDLVKLFFYVIYAEKNAVLSRECLVAVSLGDSKAPELFQSFVQSVSKEILLSAARKGDMQVIRILHIVGADFDVQDENGNNVLHLAARAGSLQVVVYLLRLFGDAGIRFAVRNTQGDSLLHKAVQSRSQEVVKLFIQVMGKDALQPNVQGETPLDLAVKLCSREIVCLLEQAFLPAELENAEQAPASVIQASDCAQEAKESRKRSYKKTSSTQAEVDWGPLIQRQLAEVEARLAAQEKEKKRLVEEAEEKQAKILADSDRFQEEQFAAATFLDPQLIADIQQQPALEALLTAEDASYAEVVSVCRKGAEETKHAALRVAIAQAWPKEAVKQLYQLCADLSDLHQALLWSCYKIGNVTKEKASLDTFAFLLEKASKLCIQAAYAGQTLLHQAAGDGSTEIVKLLLKKEARCDVKNHMGWTPRECAEKRGHAALASLIAEFEGSGRILEEEKQGEETDLHLLAREGHWRAAKRLLQNTQNPTPKNIHGGQWIPLHMAAASARGMHSVCVASSLLCFGDKQAQLEAQDKEKNRPLHLAALYGNTEMIDFLLMQGAEKEVSNAQGNTPLLLAASQGHLPAVVLLMEQGVDLTCTNQQGEHVLSLLISNWTPENAAACLEVIQNIVQRTSGVEGGRALFYKEGISLLYLAVQARAENLLHFFLQCDAFQIDIQEIEQAYALAMAEEGNESIQRLLLAHVAQHNGSLWVEALEQKYARANENEEETSDEEEEEVYINLTREKVEETGAHPELEDLLKEAEEELPKPRQKQYRHREKKVKAVLTLAQLVEVLKERDKNKMPVEAGEAPHAAGEEKASTGLESKQDAIPSRNQRRLARKKRAEEAAQSRVSHTKENGAGKKPESERVVFTEEDFPTLQQARRLPARPDASSVIPAAAAVEASQDKPAAQLPLPSSTPAKVGIVGSVSTPPGGPSVVSAAAVKSPKAKPSTPGFNQGAKAQLPSSTPAAKKKTRASGKVKSFPAASGGLFAAPTAAIKPLKKAVNLSANPQKDATWTPRYAFVPSVQEQAKPAPLAGASRKIMLRADAPEWVPPAMQKG